MAATNPVVVQLMTAPGSGPVTAVAFVATLDDVGRFRGAHQVAAFTLLPISPVAQQHHLPGGGLSHNHYEYDDEGACGEGDYTSTRKRRPSRLEAPLCDRAHAGGGNERQPPGHSWNGTRGRAQSSQPHYNSVCRRRHYAAGSLKHARVYLLRAVRSHRADDHRCCADKHDANICTGARAQSSGTIGVTAYSDESAKQHTWQPSPGHHHAPRKVDSAKQSTTPVVHAPDVVVLFRFTGSENAACRGRLHGA